jgi:hypothetical protein
VSTTSPQRKQQQEFWLVELKSLDRALKLKKWNGKFFN